MKCRGLADVWYLRMHGQVLDGSRPYIQTSSLLQQLLDYQEVIESNNTTSPMHPHLKEGPRQLRITLAEALFCSYLGCVLYGCGWYLALRRGSAVATVSGSSIGSDPRTEPTRLGTRTPPARTTNHERWARMRSYDARNVTAALSVDDGPYGSQVPREFFRRTLSCGSPCLVSPSKESAAGSCPAVKTLALFPAYILSYIHNVSQGVFPGSGVSG